eukprot:4924342-Prymnesium_polylepis.2
MTRWTPFCRYMSGSSVQRPSVAPAGCSSADIQMLLCLLSVCFCWPSMTDSSLSASGASCMPKRVQSSQTEPLSHAQAVASAPAAPPTAPPTSQPPACAEPGQFAPASRSSSSAISRHPKCVCGERASCKGRSVVKTHAAPRRRLSAGASRARPAPSAQLAACSFRASALTSRSRARSGAHGAGDSRPPRRLSSSQSASGTSGEAAGSPAIAPPSARRSPSATSSAPT